MASVNSTLTALSKGDQIKDFAHAARMFVDNNYELQPRYTHLFHVVFNLTPQAAQLFANQDKLEINMLVKSIDLPSFNIDLQTHNQYNRQVHSQHKINYNPINVTFHDDQKDLIRSLIHTYTSFYYDDARHAQNSRAYSTTDRYGDNSGDAYGLRSGNVRFFKNIQVYSMLQKRFAEYTLINPIVNALNHDTHSYGTGGFMQHTMQINYETVKYATGFVNNVNPKGFGTVHYDNTPSPLGVFGAGVDNSIFFRNGFIDVFNTVVSDLNEGNLLGAVTRGGIIFNNLKDVDLNKVLEKDLTRVLGSVLRGENPLSQIVLPNIFGLDDVIRDVLGAPDSRTPGIAGPVDRTINSSRNAIPVVSNGTRIGSSLFNQGTSLVTDIVDMGLGLLIPESQRSPSSPRRLSDGEFNTLRTSPSNSRQQKLNFLNRRIAQLEVDINNPPVGGVPAFVIRERDDLVQRRNLEFGV